MTNKTLQEIIHEKPFDDYQDWWSMGNLFIHFMSQAIVSQWRTLPHNEGDLRKVEAYVELYHQAVYQRECSANLTAEFVAMNPNRTFLSGEFDALSYGFYRAAFEHIAAHEEAFPDALAAERRKFTERVGAAFFGQVHDHLALDLPAGLHTEDDFARLKLNIDHVGIFLEAQGYLRDNFAFSFKVHTRHGSNAIAQDEEDFLPDLAQEGIAYALYEMGYPVILPSAVYLYHTIGEAQHHSSRTIEELFKRVGYIAYEVDDFDPSDYDSDCVVELWTIQPHVESQ